jgi:hypothetical protein
MTERDLRVWETRQAGALVSAEIGGAPGHPALHRPDLAVWRDDRELPLAIEVELTVKAASRLRAIVRGWARNRRVGGVVYYASPVAIGAVRRAVADEWADERVFVSEIAAAGWLPDGSRGTRSVRATSPVSSAS